MWMSTHRDAMDAAEAPDELDVSSSFLCKLLGRYRDEGTLAAKPRGGNRPPALDAGDLRELRRLVRERPDATLVELCGALRERRPAGAAVGVWTMCRALARLKLPLKKSRSTAASGTRLV